MSHVFISYVRDNQQKVDALSNALRSESIYVWLDRDQLRPGQRWRPAIRDAIKSGAYFIGCFSKEYSNRSRSYMNEELTLAIDEIRKRPADRAWFIPVIFDQEPIPDREISAVETLRDLQWVDLSGPPYSVSWKLGISRILSVIQDNATSQEKVLSHELSRSVRESVLQKTEENLGAVLRGTAKETIDAALNEFKAVEGEFGYLLRPLCEIFGNQFTSEQVRLMVTRGQPHISRGGFHGLCVLYDNHFRHMRSLGLEGVFEDLPRLKYFIRFREKYPDGDLYRLMMEHAEDELEIDGVSVDPDDFFDKFMNRAESAFLDALYSTKAKPG